jgi:hypothetical protein
MFKTTTAAAALLGTALLTSTAFAQSTAPSTGMSATPSTTATSSTATQSQSGLWRASKLSGVNVYNDNNEKLGDINDLLVDASGNVKQVIIGVGGFLGVGERYISVTLDQLKFSNEPMRSTTASNSSTPVTGGAATAPAAGSTTESSRTVGTSASGTGMSGSTASSGKTWYPDHAVLSMSKDQVKSAPEFKY